MVTLERVAIDQLGVAHAVKLELAVRLGELRTACGIQARWRSLTLWSPGLVMDDENRLHRLVDCMTCLVAEARREDGPLWPWDGSLPVIS